jgi:hypothetical protein
MVKRFGLEARIIPGAVRDGKSPNFLSRFIALKFRAINGLKQGGSP